MISSSCQGGNISNTTPNGAGEVIQPSWSCKTFPDWCCKHLHQDSPSIKSFFLTKKTNTNHEVKNHEDIMENHSNLATIWIFVCDSLILQFLRITVFRGTRAVTDANRHRQVAPERCFLSVGHMCSIEFQHLCIVTSCNITFQKLFQNPVLLHIQRSKYVFQTRLPK